MLTKFRDFLASSPLIFLVLRKIIELNFRKQKQIIREELVNQSNQKILDIGCGTGEFASLFDANQYVGIDISPEYIAYAKKKKKRNFQVMDATKMQFEDESFDFILIMAILHHLDDDDVKKALQEAKRLLNIEGKILIMEDAKIEQLQTRIVKWIQKLDKGDFIRSPEGYRALISPYFRINRERMFRNGGCVYYSAVLEK